MAIASVSPFIVSNTLDLHESEKFKEPLIRMSEFGKSKNSQGEPECTREYDPRITYFVNSGE